MFRPTAWSYGPIELYRPNPMSYRHIDLFRPIARSYKPIELCLGLLQGVIYLLYYGDESLGGGYSSHVFVVPPFLRANLDFLTIYSLPITLSALRNTVHEPGYNL